MKYLKRLLLGIQTVNMCGYLNTNSHMKPRMYVYDSVWLGRWAIKRLLELEVEIVPAVPELQPFI